MSCSIISCFECPEGAFSVELSDSDLNYLTLLHLSARQSAEDVMSVQLTNSHSRFLKRFGIAIGDIIFGGRTEQTQKDFTAASIKLLIEVTALGKTAQILMTLSRDTVERMFDHELHINSSDTPQSFNFAELPLSMTATIGEATMSANAISQIKVGDFIPLKDCKESAQIKAGGVVLGHGTITEMDNNKGLSIL
ncbi:FliM/FliN family flagellar motor C-terminal domain-containing protein [Vibrio mediterranei]|uniref:FliM/FliN family flagellar motor C-terminal domain-containing protein n=1 Tax=Vibrio mediterranei TaxID=689 RepID=UPI004068A132